MLRGRCGCNAVGYEVADEFIVAYSCHCSNCRATTGSAFMPWGEIELEKLRVAPEGTYARVPYGTLIDDPALRPMAHMFVGSKAPWYEISDDLPRHDEYPWDS
jgi:hypothetical protein